MIRRIARPMLASVFVVDGIETLRNPQPRVAAAAPLVDAAAPIVAKGEHAVNERVSVDVPPVPKDPELWVKALAGVKIGAGAMFALGKMPRTAALALAAAQVPTAVTRNAFWTESDPAAKSKKTTGLATDIALLGALGLATVDTAGKPGLAWRAGKAKTAAVAALPFVKTEGQAAAGAVSSAAHNVAEHATELAHTVQEKAPEVAATVRDQAPVYADKARDAAAPLAASALAGVAAAREKAPEVADRAREAAAPVVESALAGLDAARDHAAPMAAAAREQAAASPLADLDAADYARGKFLRLRKDAVKVAKR